MPAAPTMDFFQHQEEARRKSSILVGYYILAVVLIIVSIYAAFVGVFLYMGSKKEMDIAALVWNPTLFLWVAGITVAIVALGTIVKIVQLGGGGATVAQMLGGRPVSPSTTDRNERKILNVVEEMAIASGVPVPQVFVLDGEEGINAFAAGFSAADAVIGVTSGCIRQLSRDELQGVIAHEFSHILNGDMRLNIRLTGVLNGILVIALIGYWVLRSVGRVRSGKGKGGGGVAAIAIFALLLMAIGYIGVFFGRLIKSALSRQREFLADASSVQFTRNPSGIAGALKKIGGFNTGAKLASDKAEEASHFFFANGLAESWFNMMATHPPLHERIRRLDPAFDGDFKSARAVVEDEGGQDASMAELATGFSGRPTLRSQPVKAGDVVGTVGTPKRIHLEFASHLVESLPEELVGAIRDVAGAKCVIATLLLSRDEQVKARQIPAVGAALGVESAQRVPELLGLLAQVPRLSLLPVAELAMATLKHMPTEAYAPFKAMVTKLVAADSEVDLFEYALERMMVRRLDPTFGLFKKQVVQYYDLSPLLPAVRTLLSCIAYWGADEIPVANQAFTAGWARLGVNVSGPVPLDQCGLKAVTESLDVLAAASPNMRRKILESCSACVAADQEIKPEEAELLRAVADSLDCPIPPFVEAA